ncbi:hypothetical protein HYFRA_00009348 [Hymenoscyphus fraxineus]|uniref:Uncharacterized protein n=1 Tax=Hymenoscyphus fraxineus TaxID=746836 RepID=A0A9N9L521_9HELO|nr:hypothetical protein HYFRA_00009348 [Hymenoscyphus fraxineus]
MTSYLKYSKNLCIPGSQQEIHDCLCYPPINSTITPTAHRPSLNLDNYIQTPKKLPPQTTEPADRGN